jgi:hypothetical protein
LAFIISVKAAPVRGRVGEKRENRPEHAFSCQLGGFRHAGIDQDIFPAILPEVRLRIISKVIGEPVGSA